MSQPLLAHLGFGDLLDGPGIQCSLTVTESCYCLLCDWDVGAVSLCLVVEEPGWEAVLVQGGETVEALVDKLGGCNLAVDELVGKCLCLSSEETLG